MKHNARYSKGFTLVEIIIAVAFIGIIAVAFFSVTSFAVKELASSNDYMQKNYQVQGELDEFIGTRDSTGTSPETVNITWSTVPYAPTVPDFNVSGVRLDKQSDAFHFDETFKAFVPFSISP